MRNDSGYQSERQRPGQPPPARGSGGRTTTAGRRRVGGGAGAAPAHARPGAWETIADMTEETR